MHEQTMRFTTMLKTKKKRIIKPIIHHPPFEPLPVMYTSCAYVSSWNSSKFFVMSFRQQKNFHPKAPANFLGLPMAWGGWFSSNISVKLGVFRYKPWSSTAASPEKSFSPWTIRRFRFFGFTIIFLIEKTHNSGVKHWNMFCAKHTENIRKPGRSWRSSNFTKLQFSNFFFFHQHWSIPGPSSRHAIETLRNGELTPFFRNHFWHPDLKVLVSGFHIWILLQHSKLNSMNTCEIGETGEKTTPDRKEKQNLAQNHHPPSICHPKLTIVSRLSPDCTSRSSCDL